MTTTISAPCGHLEVLAAGLADACTVRLVELARRAAAEIEEHEHVAVRSWDALMEHCDTNMLVLDALTEFGCPLPSGNRYTAKFDRWCGFANTIVDRVDDTAWSTEEAHTS